MTPKDKAKELVDKFTNLYEGINLGLAKKHWAKQSALLAVDEILNTLKIFPEKDTTSKSVVNFSISRIVYWVQVKKEIEAL